MLTAVTPNSVNTPKSAPRLLDCMRLALRYRHYSLRTEEAYIYWVKFFVNFNDKRHPVDMGKDEIVAFLSWLASVRQV